MNERHHKVLQLVGRAVTQSAEFLNSGEWDRATPEYVQSLLRRELQRVSWELARLLEPAVRDLVDESPFMRYDLRTHTEMVLSAMAGHPHAIEWLWWRRFLGMWREIRRHLSGELWPLGPRISGNSP